MYLVDSALRQALLGIDRNALVQPEIYGPVLENAAASAIMAARPPGATVGFWKDGKWECDLVLLLPEASALLVEVKRTADSATDLQGIRRAARALRPSEPGSFLGMLLHGTPDRTPKYVEWGVIAEEHPATWLYTFHPTG